MSLIKLLTTATLLAATPAAAQLPPARVDSLEKAAVAMKSSRPDTALAHFRKALLSHKVSLDRRREATVLTHIGELHAGAGRFDSARTAYDDALAIRRALGDAAGEGDILTDLGGLYSQLGQFDSAFLSLRQALALLRRAGDAKNEAVALSNIGHAFGETGKPDSAMAYHRAALPISRAVNDTSGEATSLNNIGNVYNDTGEPDSALVYFTAALGLARTAGDLELSATVLNNIGTLYAVTGKPDSSLHYFYLALATQHQLGTRFQEVTTLGNIGFVQSSAGRADSALFYYRRSLEIARAIGDRVGEATALSNMGSEYKGIGRPDSALAYWRAALPIHRLANDRQGEGVTLYGMGTTFIETNPDSALAYYRLALPIFRETGSRWSEATTLQSIGGVFRDMHRPDSAIVYLRQALPIQREIDDRHGEAMSLNHLGRLYRNTARPDSALAAFTQALAIQREIRDPGGEALSLDNIAYLYHTAAVPFRDLRSATVFYDSAAAVFAALRRQAGSDANAVSYAEQEFGVYEHWSGAWAGLARSLAGDAAAEARAAALAAAERGRAQAIVDLMVGGGRGSAKSGEDDVAKPGRDLQHEAGELLAPLRAARASLLYYQHAADTLSVWHLEPGGRLSLDQRPITAEQLAGLIASLRTGLGAESARQGMARGNAEQEATRRGFDLLDEGEVSAALATISELLLPAGVRAARRGSELIVVPHGVLGLVPFSALHVKGDAVPLGARFAVRYAPSLRALAAAEARPAPPETAKPLVVANPDMPQVATTSGSKVALAELPGAQREGEWLAARLGVPLVAGRAASEGTVRKALPAARLVHLATHGLAFGNDAAVRNSYVALAPDSLHDGLLTLGEIMDDDALTLTADLVVLSACQTGLGNPKQAEGTVGLQRGLLAKGARTVLVSLWSVDDEATGFLMRRFYERWLTGATKAEALRRAQIDVRSDKAHPQWSHPRYWAAFQLVGAR
ncbi:MAG: tetratricopeptide repeat protein [Gemmatimonadaceae bacterium]|nr:tetratricopeptide repeat protein [Gemmatimonadaceae bacterium]